MRLLKRTLSAFLAFVMVFTMLPLQVWASETQQSANDSVNFGSIVADGTDDDRALEEVGNDVDTYIFKIEGVSEPVSTQYVKNGEEVYAPEAPAKEGYKFVGWFEGEAQFVAGPAKVDEGNIQHTYTARYQQVYYVFFMDGIDDNAAVVHTEEGVSGAVIKTTDVTFPMEQGQGISGWYRNAELSDGPVAEVVIENSNITLYPKVEKGNWISFDTVGADPIAPVFVAPNQNPVVPTPPVKTGFTFNGWKTDGGEDFDFAKPLTADVKLVAQWDGNDGIEYKVFYWVENADDDGYSLVNSETLTGKAGEKAVNENIELHLPKEYPDQTLAKAVTFNADKTGKDGEKTIAGDGSTIVNVYYDREEYTVEFLDRNGNPFRELTCGQEEHTHWKGSWYDSSDCYDRNGKFTCRKQEHTHGPQCGDSKDITAKYGAYIGDKWPDASNGSKQWYVSNEWLDQTSQLNIQTMPYKGATFYDRAQGEPAKNGAHYHLEILGKDGEYFEHHVDCADGGSVTEEDLYDIKGFTVNEKTYAYYYNNDRWGMAYVNAQFYYDRNDYTLTLVNKGQTVEKTLQYEAPLADHVEDPNNPGLPQNYEFKGWYLDENFTNEFVVEGKTMPANNLTLYALWAAPEITVTAFDDMVSGKPNPHEIKVSYNGTIDKEELPKITEDRKGFQFVGWATYENGVYTPFNLNTPLAEDITIYPYWISTETFKVSYDLEGVADAKIYRDGAFADVQPLPDGFTNPNGKVFLGWKADRESDNNLYQPGDKIQIQNANVTLKAQWGDMAQKTTLTYHPGYDGANSVEEHWANNEMVTLKTPDDLGFNREGFDFLGWATSAGSEAVYRAGDTIRVNTKNANTDNHLYAVWKENFKQGDPIKVRVVKDGEEVNASEYVTVGVDEKGTPSLKAENTGNVYSLSYTYEEKNCADFYLNKTGTEKFTGYTVDVTHNGTPVVGAEPIIKDTNNGWHLDNIPGGATVTVSLNTQKFTVKYDASPDEGGMVKDAAGLLSHTRIESVAYGKEATGATAVPNEGYYFVKWQDAAGNLVSTNAAFTPAGEVTENATYTAVFAKKTEITVKANDLSKVYDGSPITAEKATYTDTGLPEGYTLAVTYETVNTPTNVADPKGTLLIKEVKVFKDGQDVTDQFTIDTKTGALSIDPKPVKITVNNSEKQYGELDPKFMGKVDGLVKEGDLGEVTFTRTNTDEEAVDVYPDVLTANYTANANYDVSIDPGDFEIKQNTTAKVVVTIVGCTKTENYNGSTYTVEGYDVTSITVSDVSPNLYTETDVVLAEGKAAKASGIEAGTYNMGLTADSFKNNNPNFADANVSFVVTDGYLTINPAKVTVTIMGNQETKTYNGSEQSVVGYQVDVPKDSGYSKESITFVGEAIAKGTDVGTYYMGLPEKQFGNNDTNYDVTFVVHDGWLRIGPVTDEVHVTIVGNHNTVTYNGKPHTVKGYDVTSITLGGKPTNLYKETDVVLAKDATAEITQTNANIREEKYLMGLTADSFKNNSENFTNVVFEVTDGWLRIDPATMTLTAVGYDEKYDGDPHGGTVTAPKEATLTYSTDGGVTWTPTAPTVENVADGKITVNVKATLANYKDAEATYTLNVQPRNVTLTSGNSSVAYGNTAKNEAVTVSGDGFAPDEGVTYSNFASLTLVGSKDNTFDYTLNEGTDVRNYNIEPKYGTLTVTTEGDEDKDVVTKTHASKDGGYKLGDTVTFTIKVTNIYNKEMTLIVEELPSVTIVGGVPKTIGAGKTIELTATYQITEDDIKNGSFVNTVTVKLGDIPFKGEDTVELEKAEGALTVEKTITNGDENKPFALGESIEYKIVVTNSGNVTLENITLSDVLNVGEGEGKNLTATPSGNFAGTLAPGASVTYTASYTVEEDDLGKTIVNTATATGSYTDENGTKTVEGTDKATATTAAVNPALTVEKTITNGKATNNTFALDKTIEYEITVKNTGNQTLNNIVVTDPLTGMKETIDTLAPNGTASFETSYQVTMGDVLAGQVVNTATATAGNVVASHDATATITGLDSLSAEVQLNSGSHIYDGKDHTVEDGTLTVKLGNAVQTGFSVEFDEGTATATGKHVRYENGEVAGYPVTAAAENVTIRYNGKDVTKKFVGKIDITEGALTINPKAVTLRTESASKDYNGEPLTKPGVSGVTGENGFIPADVEQVEATGTQTLVGESKNTIEIVWAGNALAKNYTITENLGTLTVTAPKDFDYVQKTHQEGNYTVGQTVYFTITVTNIYAVDATVQLNEQKDMTITGVDDKGQDVLRAGETKTYSVSYVVTKADVEAGQIRNEVTWTLTPKGKDPIPGSDDSTIENESYLVWYVLKGDTEGCINLGTMPKQANHKYGTTVTVWMPELAEGYKFSNWSVEGAKIVGGKFTVPENAVILTGTISKEQVKVTYSAEEGGLVTNPKSGLTSESFAETLSYGANAQGAVAVANEGYTFLGWKRDNAFVEQDEVIAPTEVKESVTYTAVFAKNYTVTYRVEGETGAYATQTHYAGETGVEVLDNAPAKTGYDFSGWKTADTTVLNGKFTMPEQDVLFTGSYTAHTNLVWYVLEGDTKGCTNILEMPKQANYAYDTDMTVWMPELAEGYEFSGWTVDGAVIENGAFSMPDNAVILTGTISKEQVKVDYKAQEGGLITDSNGLSYADLAEMVPYGENAKGATASAKKGYTFVEWQDANHKQVSTDPEFIPTNVTAPATYYAVFAKQKVKVEYTADVGGFITSPSGATFGSVIEQVTYGEDAVGAIASAKPGYYFVHWLDAEGNEVGTELHFAPEDVTEEAVYKAVFAEQTAIEVKAEDLRKEYDGTAIEANGKYTTNTTLKDGHKLVVTTKVSKEVINVSDTDGKHQIESIKILDANDKDVTGQYQVRKADGSLTILPKPISIEVADGVKTYGETNLEITVTANGLVNGNDLGEITYERESESENAGVYTDDLWPVYTPNPNYTVTEMPGTLTINKRKVALESESGEQVYNGKALTKPDVKIGDVKLVEGDAEVNATGTQTLVGESVNTIEITWKDKTVAGNYEIIKTEGKLTVTAPENLDDYVVKTHEGQNFKVGDTVTFKITVTNIYAVNATVKMEEMAGMTFGNGQTALEDTLTPGQTKTYTATRILTEQDFENGGVSNTVKVTLDPEKDGEPEIPGTDTDEVPLEPKPDMSVVKTVLNPKESYEVGDTIRYQITVTNTGNVPLHDLELTDVMNADGKVTFPAGTVLTRDTLDVGGSWTVTCSYVVRDADEGKTLSNTAKVITHKPGTDDPVVDEEDRTDGEPVEKRYSLTIHYRNEQGAAVANSYTGRFHAGDSFKIDSPVVAGYYAPRIASIASPESGMPAQDLEYVVTYTAIPAPVDPDPDGPNPGPNVPDDDDDDTPPVPDPEQEQPQPPEPEDFVIDPNDYTLTEVEDNETPLANMDLDGHTCCIMHLLLMLAAMVVLGFYTKSRKKHQARIFELKRMLAMEEDHSDDPEQP